ncbi:hypothetical protein ACTNEO_00895 [Gracilibacillus sp. HCP3S3_G5_1]|uniref:hypothetical protein n=1 Tax=unclassified Gracilibacillus TaxID=2625209 RepID=UPI003F8BE45F
MKNLSVSMLLLLIIPSTLFALSSNSPYVLLDGRVYEITDEQINHVLIGQSVGEVTTQADDRTTTYFGNASNHYSIGTKYFKIEGIDIAEAIAVEEQAAYVKAEFSHRAPLHWRTIISYLTPILFLTGLIVIYRIREQLKKTYQSSLSR